MTGQLMSIALQLTRLPSVTMAGSTPVQSGMVGVAVGVLALLYFLPRCLERRLHRRRGAGDGHHWLGLVPVGPKPASS